MAPDAARVNELSAIEVALEPSVTRAYGHAEAAPAPMRALANQFEAVGASVRKAID